MLVNHKKQQLILSHHNFIFILMIRLLLLLIFASNTKILLVHGVDGRNNNQLLYPHSSFRYHHHYQSSCRYQHRHHDKSSSSSLFVVTAFHLRQQQQYRQRQQKRKLYILFCNDMNQKPQPQQHQHQQKDLDAGMNQISSNHKNYNNLEWIMNHDNNHHLNNKMTTIRNNDRIESEQKQKRHKQSISIIPSYKDDNDINNDNHLISFIKNNILSLTTIMMMLIVLIPTVTYAVEVFDGSTIINPIVVSNLFWYNLQNQFVALLIAQLIAIVIFSIIATYTSTFMIQLLSSKNTTTSTTNNNNDNMNPWNNKKKKNKNDDKTELTKQRSIDIVSLSICIIIDLLGSLSEIIPGGYLFDILYAPIAGLLLRSLYNNNNMILLIEVAEEIIPFRADLLPFATICWLIDTFYDTSDIAKLLQLGRYKPFRKMKK